MNWNGGSLQYFEPSGSNKQVIVIDGFVYIMRKANFFESVDTFKNDPK